MAPKNLPPGASSQRTWRIPAFPVLNTSLAFKSHETPPFPFDAANLTLWVNARVALWQGLKYLDLKAGDRILAPAYACGFEIDVLLKFGLQLDLSQLIKE